MPGRRGVAWIAFTSRDICAAKGVPRQKRAGIDHQKQKPVILHLAARDRRAGEEAEGLDREGQTIAFMSAKSGDTAPCRRASVCGGVPVGVEGYARRQCFAGFGGKQYLAPHQRSRTDVENDRPVGRRKAEGDRVGPKSRAGCAGRHDVRRATNASADRLNACARGFHLHRDSSERQEGRSFLKEGRPEIRRRRVVGPQPWGFLAVRWRLNIW